MRSMINATALPVTTAPRLADAAPARLWPKPFVLSDREVEALVWVARGKTSFEIAKILGLKKRTVDFHVDSARAKLGAATRSEAVIKATTVGLIKP